MSIEVRADSVGHSVRAGTAAGRVLVIDDEPSIRDLLVDALSIRGFVMAAAPSGEKGIEALRSEKFDVAITDLVMPGMDGLETTRALKEIDPAIEVIILTGNATVDSAIKGIKLGVFDYLQKPVKLAELEAVLRRALERGHLQSAGALYEATRSLSGTLRKDELIPLALGLAKKALAADASAIGLFEGEAGGDAPESHVSDGNCPGALVLSLSGRWRDARHPVRLPEAGTHECIAELLAAGFASAIVFPLDGRSKRLGGLVVFRNASSPGFSGAEIARGAALAGQISLTLENARLYRELERKIEEAVTARDQLVQTEKLALAGQISAGVAHEINTPIQFISDSVHFLRTAFSDLQGLIDGYRSLKEAAREGPVPAEKIATIDKAEEDADLAFLSEQIPKAIERTLEGAARVADIVRALKDFVHRDRHEKSASNLNRALQSTLTVARNELKYVSDVETEFGDIPLVVCRSGEINQVFLNLLVNAAHAIQEVVGDSGKKGRIGVRTQCDGSDVVVEISDTGGGIPDSIRSRIFDPFFTTKEVGKGTGQGLAIARAIVVERHGGSITYETEIGKGTRFFVRLPIDGRIGGTVPGAP